MMTPSPSSLLTKTTTTALSFSAVASRNLPPDLSSNGNGGTTIESLSSRDNVIDKEVVAMTHRRRRRLVTYDNHHGGGANSTAASASDDLTGHNSLDDEANNDCDTKSSLKIGKIGRKRKNANIDNIPDDSRRKMEGNSNAENRSQNNATNNQEDDDLFFPSNDFANSTDGMLVDFSQFFLEFSPIMFPPAEEQSTVGTSDLSDDFIFLGALRRTLETYLNDTLALEEFSLFYEDDMVGDDGTEFGQVIVDRMSVVAVRGMNDYDHLGSMKANNEGENANEPLRFLKSNNHSLRMTRQTAQLEMPRGITQLPGVTAVQTPGQNEIAEVTTNHTHSVKAEIASPMDRFLESSSATSSIIISLSGQAFYRFGPGGMYFSSVPSTPQLNGWVEKAFLLETVVEIDVDEELSANEREYALATTIRNDAMTSPELRMFQSLQNVTILEEGDWDVMEPTSFPTKSPTLSPTLSPSTLKPTISPSDTLFLPLTVGPSNSPVSNPTASPSMNPTIPPLTEQPSVPPSTAPKLVPNTYAPTLATSLFPTETSSHLPTANNTSDGTSAPIASPTASPVASLPSSDSPAVRPTTPAPASKPVSMEIPSSSPTLSPFSPSNFHSENPTAPTPTELPTWSLRPAPSIIENGPPPGGNENTSSSIELSNASSTDSKGNESVGIIVIASSAAVVVSLVLMAAMLVRRRRQNHRCGRSDGDEIEKHVGISPSRTDDLLVSDVDSNDDGNDLELGNRDSIFRHESNVAVHHSSGENGLGAMDSLKLSKKFPSNVCPSEESELPVLKDRCSHVKEDQRDDRDDDLETKHCPLSSWDSLNDSYVEHPAFTPSSEIIAGINHSSPFSAEMHVQRARNTSCFGELPSGANDDVSTGGDKCTYSSRWISSHPKGVNTQLSFRPTGALRFPFHENAYYDDHTHNRVGPVDQTPPIGNSRDSRPIAKGTNRSESDPMTSPNVVSPSSLSIRNGSPQKSKNDTDNIHNQIILPLDPSGHNTIAPRNNDRMDSNITVITDDDDDSLNYTDITMDDISEYPILSNGFGQWENSNIHEKDDWISPSKVAPGNVFPFLSATRRCSSFNESTKDILVGYGDGDDDDDDDDSGRDVFRPWKEQYILQTKEGADGNQHDITNNMANPSKVDIVEHNSEYDPDSDWDVDDAEVDGRESESDVFELKQPSCYLGHGALHEKIDSP